MGVGMAGLRRARYGLRGGVGMEEEEIDMRGGWGI